MLNVTVTFQETVIQNTTTLEDNQINVTVLQKDGVDGKSIEADIDIANQRVGFKQEGEANFTYIDLPKLEFDDLTEAQKDSLKLTFDQLTQAEKDSLKGEQGLQGIQGEKGDMAIQGEYISYTTLADAQAVNPKPSDGTLFQVEEEANKGVYTFQSGEAGGTRFEEPSVYDLMKEKITIQVGKNKFNIDDPNNIIDFYILNESLEPNTSFNVTHPIQIKPSTNYALNYKHRLLWLDANGDVITEDSDNLAQSNIVVSSPVNAEYVRCSVDKSSWLNFMIEEGSVSTEFEEYNQLNSKYYTKNGVNKFLNSIEFRSSIFKETNILTGGDFSDLTYFIQSNIQSNNTPSLEIVSEPNPLLLDTAVKASLYKNTGENVRLRILKRLYTNGESFFSSSVYVKFDPLKSTARLQLEGYIDGVYQGTITTVFASSTPQEDGWWIIPITNIDISSYDEIVIGVRIENSVFDELTTTYITGFAAEFTQEEVYYRYNPVIGLLQNEKYKNSLSLDFSLKDKKLIVYGDSISSRYTWHSIVSSHYQLITTLRGIGSSTVKETSDIAWIDSNGNYLARPPETQPEGSTEINASMSALDRIQAMIPADCDIITILGGTNDFDNNGSTTLGDISDTGTSTFYGAYQTMLDRIQTQAPNAEIIIITPPFAIGEDVDFENTRKAIREVALKYKFRLCELSESGINKNNHTVYLSDGIHPNLEGDKKIAREVIRSMKNLVV